MFKKLPLLAAALFAFAAYGQTIVSTSPENKNVVLEEFTGIYCGYCPDGHAIAQAIQDANPDRVSLINIHTGGFANPTGNDPDFRTVYGKAIAQQSNLTGYPAGTVNRHVFPGRGMNSGATAMGRGQWTVSANEILNQPSYVNVAVEATIDVESNTMEIHVEAYYTGNSPESSNLLNIAILQNNTRGPQSGGGQGNNYNHMHRLIDFVTGQWGEEITETTEGTFIDRTYSYPLLDHNNQIPVEIGELEVVAYITETQQEVISGNRATPTIEGIVHSNDARVRFIEEVEDACYGEELTFTPKVNIQNIGTNAVSSLEIEYTLNGAPSTFSWSGTLASLESKTISLPQVTTTVGETNTFGVTIPDDDNNANNSLTVPFGAPYTSGTVDLNIIAGANGDKLRWRIRTDEGTVIHRGGPFEPGETYYERFNLDEGCFVLFLMDSSGAGDNYISLTDHEGNIIYQSDQPFGNTLLKQFYSNGVLGVNDLNMDEISIYPNPAQDVLYISNAEEADIQVFDVLGKSILSKSRISMNEGIQVDHLPAGAYFLKISKNGNMTTKKFLIAR